MYNIRPESIRLKGDFCISALSQPKIKTEGVITMKNTEKTMEKIVALCKGRGFVFSGSEIYGGLANTWDYGPLGVEL